MPNPRKGKKSKKRSTRRSKPNFHSATLIAYHGPVLMPKSNEADNVVTFNMSYFLAITASAGGIVDVVYGSANVTLCSNWSTLSGGFHEYRVIAMKVDYVPQVNYTSLYPPLVGVVDRNSAGALGGYTTGANHDSAHLWSSRDKHAIVSKMNGIDEAGWISVSSTTHKFYTKIYGANFGAAQSVGTAFQTFLVQFRVVS